MSVISAGTTLTTALVQTGDTNGNLVFRTGSGGTTALTLGSDQSATFAGAVSFSGGATLTNPTINGNVTTTGLNFDSNTLVIDANNNSVGIGTSSPDRFLSVYSSGQEWPMLIRGASNTSTNRMSMFLSQRARGSISSPSVVTADTILGGVEVGGYNGSAYTYGFNGGASIFMYAADTWTSTSCPTYLTLSTNSPGVAGHTERMRINADGSIRMNCNGSVISHTFGFNENGGQIDLYDETGVSATLIDQASNSTRVLELINGSNLLLGLGSSNTTGSIMFMGAGYSERMRIDSSGNVGIGTSSPSTAVGPGNLGFVLNGGANGVQFKLQNTTTGSTGSDGVLLSLDASSNGYLWNYENAAFIFGTNNTERMRIRSDGGILSQPTGGGTLIEQFGCRAWVCFNGTGTLAIKSSGNVSSVTDNGTGDYTVNFTTAMPDANYAIATCGVIPDDAGGAPAFFLRGPTGWGTNPTLKSTTQARLLNRRETNLDMADCSVSIFR